MGTIGKRITIVILLLVVEEHGVHIVHFAENAVVREHSFQIDGLIAPFSSFFIAQELLSGGLHISDDVALCIACGGGIVVIGVLGTCHGSCRELVKREGSLELQSRCDELQILFQRY